MPRPRRLARGDAFADNQTRDDGAVAQLGERCNGIAEVRGSIPLGSTILLILSENIGYAARNALN